MVIHRTSLPTVGRLVSRPHLGIPVSLAVVKEHRTGEEMVNYVRRLAELCAGYLERLFGERQSATEAIITEVEGRRLGGAVGARTILASYGEKSMRWYVPETR
jgi:hypothetical protein